MQDYGHSHHSRLQCSGLDQPSMVGRVRPVLAGAASEPVDLQLDQSIGKA